MDVITPYELSNLFVNSGSLSESLQYYPTIDFNTIYVPSASISESIGYNPFYNFDTIND